MLVFFHGHAGVKQFIASNDHLSLILLIKANIVYYTVWLYKNVNLSIVYNKYYFVYYIFSWQNCF